MPGSSASDKRPNRLCLLFCAWALLLAQAEAQRLSRGRLQSQSDAHAALNAIIVSIPNDSARPGEVIVLPIRVSSAAGITGAEMKITFDDKILRADSVGKTPLTSGFISEATITSGKIVLVLARATGITSGSGDLVRLFFTVQPTAQPGDSTVLAWAHLVLYDEATDTIPSTGKNGLFLVRGPKDITAPTAPQNLQAEAGNRKVTLRWNANTESDLLQYRIYRSEGLQASTEIDSVAAGTTIYADNDVDNDTTYFYRITAVDQARNESAFSNEASATPSAHHAPEVLNPIPDVTLFIDDDNLVRDLNLVPVVFIDRDDDPLTYSATSSNEAIATVSVLNSTFTVTLVDTGNSTITVTANDNRDGVASTSFKVTVIGTPPPTTISVAPNPFTPNNDKSHDVAKFAWPREAAPTEILIFSLSGRRVRSLEAAQRDHAIWDGRDDDNRNLGPGVYLYLVQADGKRIASGTVTLMR